ncbi:MAG: UbiA family prenyltransferase [Chitinophagaceae bacterium]
MKWLKHLLAFLVYSNLFIACCAILMVFQSARLLNGGDPAPILVQFVFFATICSYNFHYYFTTHSLIPSPRIQWQKKNRTLLLLLFLGGASGATICFIELRAYWPWLLPAAVATFLYSAPKLPHPVFHRLRKVAFGKTIFLAFIWMYVTTVLPYIVSGQTWNDTSTIYALSRYFFIYAICILFDYRDREDDRAEGVRSLVTFLSDRNINRLFYFALFAYILFTAWLGLRGFTADYLIMLFIPGIILLLLYNYARRHFTDMLYYVILDGLMALSAILMMIAGI